MGGGAGSEQAQGRGAGGGDGGTHLDPQALHRVGLEGGPRLQQQLWVLPQWQQGPPKPEDGILVRREGGACPAGGLARRGSNRGRPAPG